MSEEKRFDLELTGQLAEFDMSALPEEEQVLASPWQHLANKLVWGVVFSTITLHFLYLDLILPAIGIIWLVQALRPLRRENSWLRLCHGLTWVLCAVRLTGFALQGTLLPESALYAALKLPVGLAVVAVWLVFYFALWRGLLAIARRAGQENPSAPGAAMLMVWYGALMALALSGVQQVGWFAFGLMLLLYFLILRSVWKTLHFFEENGYVLQPLRPHLSDRALTWLWLAAVVAVITLALTFGTRYPMDWQPRPADEQAGYEEIVENLRALGLPEDMVADVAGEDLAALADAERVLLGRSETFHTDDGGKLLCRSAAIRLPGEERWVTLQHFLWQEVPRHRGTEALQAILLHEQYVPNGLVYFRADETLPVRVRLLYEEGEDIFTNSPELVPMSTTSWFGDEYTARYASWSLPRQGNRARGYLLYGVYRCDAVSMVTSTDYIHNQQAVYPALSARQYAVNGFWGDDPKFRTMQYYLDIHYSELQD